MLACTSGSWSSRAPERLAVEHEEPERSLRRHGRRSRDVLEEPDLAEEFARPECRDHVTATGDLDLALDDDEELVCGLALAAEHFAGVHLESSVIFASWVSSFFDRPEKSGTRPSALAFVSCEKSDTGAPYSTGKAASKARAKARAACARWLCSAFQASPSSATVRSSPSGTKTGS